MRISPSPSAPPPLPPHAPHHHHTHILSEETLLVASGDGREQSKLASQLSCFKHSTSLEEPEKKHRFEGQGAFLLLCSPKQNKTKAKAKQARKESPSLGCRDGNGEDTGRPGWKKEQTGPRTASQIASAPTCSECDRETITTV